ncbi:SDR family NAD(P)-dependent oxidoreductase [Paenibacillus spongiae]|uniref:SDR family oxidoreductase n=1 Tax=Paenibacillus spongiae TaxID=2909671 RepID=A0ABY5S4S3_9BACL|nr:SDR family oxidoreductase [Paenibacillus spongiae]UVI28679.1 SDR family oxidoreductase [Paenibacillus spongiae]
MQVLQGKIIFITGAASGIGAETARQLADRGAIPIITGRNEMKLKDTAASLKGAFGCYKLDVRDQDEVSNVIARAAYDFGRIDVLLNNAGYGLFEAFEDAPLEHFADMMDTNYMGIVRCTKMVLPIMRHQGGGHIVNVASMAGKLSTAKASGYAATKHAVLGLTNALRTELKPLGIAVSAVNPGPIDTPFLHAADPEGNYAKNVRSYMLKPDKVAEAIVRVIERQTPEVDLPWSAGIGIRLYSMAPRLADKVAGRFLNRK